MVQNANADTACVSQQYVYFFPIFLQYHVNWETYNFTKPKIFQITLYSEYILNYQYYA